MSISLTSKFAPSTSLRALCASKLSPSHSHRPANSIRLFASAVPMAAPNNLDASTSTVRVAVVGAGISGLVAASILAERGAHVAVFDLGRGPGGRMSQRREKITVAPKFDDKLDGSEASELPNLEARFDHGAQCFTVTDPNVLSFLERRLGGTGALAEWKGRFGVWDASKGEFRPEGVKEAGDGDAEAGQGGATDLGAVEGGAGGEAKLGLNRRLVGVPGMNALCQTLLAAPPATPASSTRTGSISARFGVQVARADWLAQPDSLEAPDHDSVGVQPYSWEVFSSAGDSLGRFHGLVIAAAYRTMPVLLPDLLSLAQVRQGLAEVRASPRFAMMLAFAEPLARINLDGVTVAGSEVIAWIGRDSSKPGRSGKAQAEQGIAEVGGVGSTSANNRREPSTEGVREAECWVVHSTAAYASTILASAPPGRPSPALLAQVSADMWGAVKPILSKPVPACAGGVEGVERGVGGVERGVEVEEVVPTLMKVHRWGGAFPVAGVTGEGEKCLWSEQGRVAACGDYCIGSPAGGLAGGPVEGGSVEGAIASGMEAGRRMADVLGLGRSSL